MKYFQSKMYKILILRSLVATWLAFCLISYNATEGNCQNIRGGNFLLSGTDYQMPIGVDGQAYCAIIELETMPSAASWQFAVASTGATLQPFMQSTAATITVEAGNRLKINFTVPANASTTFAFGVRVKIIGTSGTTTSTIKNQTGSGDAVFSFIFVPLPPGTPAVSFERPSLTDRDADAQSDDLFVNGTNLLNVINGEAVATPLNFKLPPSTITSGADLVFSAKLSARKEGEFRLLPLLSSVSGLTSGSSIETYVVENATTGELLQTYKLHIEFAGSVTSSTTVTIPLAPAWCNGGVITSAPATPQITISFVPPTLPTITLNTGTTITDPISGAPYNPTAIFTLNNPPASITANNQVTWAIETTPASAATKLGAILTGSLTGTVFSATLHQNGMATVSAPPGPFSFNVKATLDPTPLLPASGDEINVHSAAFTVNVQAPPCPMLHNPNTLIVQVVDSSIPNALDGQQIYNTEIKRAVDWLNKISLESISIRPEIYRCGQPDQKLQIDLKIPPGKTTNKFGLRNICNRGNDNDISPIIALGKEVLKQVNETGYEHVILLVDGLNDEIQDCHYATNGKWGFDLNDDGIADQQVSLNIHFKNDDWTSYARALARNLGLQDLFLHGDLVLYGTTKNDLTKRLPNGWDLMAYKDLNIIVNETAANPFGPVHPLYFSKDQWPGTRWLKNKLHPRYLYTVHEKKSFALSAGGFTKLRFQNEILSSGDIDATAAGLERAAFIIHNGSDETSDMSDMADATSFTIIEARKANTAENAQDNVSPSPAVLVYRAYKNVGDGGAPIISVDPSKFVALSEGQSYPIGGGVDSYGLSVQFHSVSADDRAANVNINYNPTLASDFLVDIAIRPKEGVYWQSPDIWVAAGEAVLPGTVSQGGESIHVTQTPFAPDSQPKFLDTDAFSDHADDTYILGENNFVFARIHNKSEKDAKKIVLDFKISTPYMTASPSYNSISRVLVEELKAKHYIDAFFNWSGSVPAGFDQLTESEQSAYFHRCLKVDIIENRGLPISALDKGPDNNSAMQNLDGRRTTRNSPYQEIIHVFSVSNTDPISNPEQKARRFIFKLEGIPSTWSFHLQDKDTLLQFGQSYIGTLKVKPPDNEIMCKEYPIYLTAWTPEAHTIKRAGGLTLNVQTRNRVGLTMNTTTAACDNVIKENVYKETQTRWSAMKESNVNHLTYNDRIYDSKAYRFYQINNQEEYAAYLVQKILGASKNDLDFHCAQISTNGCTDPIRPNEEIIIRYTDPDGNPLYKKVITDANGCYSDVFDTHEGGPWEVSAYYPGGDCDADTSRYTLINVPGDHTIDTDKDGLPDGKEIAGWDFDGDGLFNFLDFDSDNDGISDGREPLGNYDCDSFENAVDADSDNDDIPDGRDQTPYGNIPLHRVFFSALYHRFDFDTDLPVKDGHGFNLRIGVNLHPKWALESEVGLTGTKGADNQSGKVYNINLNGLYYFAPRPTAIVSPYLSAGLGGLLFRGFPQPAGTFALNGGVGFFVMQPNFIPGLALRAETKAHYGFSGYDVDGHLNLQYSLGLTYRFRTKATPCNIEKRTRASRR